MITLCSCVCTVCGYTFGARVYRGDVPICGKCGGDAEIDETGEIDGE